MSQSNEHDLARRQRLYNDPTFSDITICFDGNKIHAHKSILSMSSDYFFSAFTGNFMEATAEEMQLHEDLPEGVIGMLRFIYGLGTTGDDCSTFHQIALMAVADKYGVESLYAAAKAVLAERLEQLELPWADFYPELLHDIYDTPACDKETRSLAVAVGQKNIKEWLLQEDFKKVLIEKPEICIDMLNAVVAGHTQATAALKTECKTSQMRTVSMLRQMAMFT